MRYVAVMGLASLALAGCALGDEKVKGAADADVVDVAVLEIGGDETSADTGGDAAEDSSIADSVSDSVATDSASMDSISDSVSMDSISDSDSGSMDSASDTDSGSMDAGSPWSHTIAIDGTNEFASGEAFATTSASYTAYVTWDATYVYWGMQGPDVGTSASASKWIFLYADTDPGAGTGATKGVKYNTEEPSFPTGFGAEYYVRYKTDDSYATIEHYSAGSWSTVATAVDHKRTGNYVEFRIKRSDLGSPAKVGLELFMVNETGGAEGAYAGIYAGNFTDGYHASIPITKYLDADFAASTPPNDASRTKP